MLNDACFGFVVLVSPLFFGVGEFALLRFFAAAAGVFWSLEIILMEL